MRSKTSYFNKTIFFKNITRFWPIWSAYLLVCLIRLPLAIYTALNTQATDILDLDAFRLNQLTNTIYHALHPFFLFLFAFLAIIAVFSYLYQPRSANMIHALPVCRESLFITNLLSGICFLIIPQIIAFLAGIFVCFSLEMTQLEFLMHWLLLSTGMSIFALALAALSIMITGNIVAAPVFFLFINFGFIACKAIIEWFVEKLSYGIKTANISFGAFLSPLYFLADYFNQSRVYDSYGSPGKIELSVAYTYVGCYFIAAFILFILAFLLYKKKHIETTGDVITLPFLKPFFRWIAAFCIGSCLTLFGYDIFITPDKKQNPLLYLILATILGNIIIFFLTEMFLSKSFRVFQKKRLLECGVYIILVLTFIIGTNNNMFGLETRIPKKKDIASIYVYGSYPFLVEESDYDKVLQLHQKLIDSRQEIESYFKKYIENSRYTSLDITYTLTDGSTISRSYDLPIEDYYLDQEAYAYHLLDSISYNPEYYLRYHFTDSYESATFVDGSFDIYSGNDFFDSVMLNQEQCNIIFEAFQKDVRQGNYHIYDFSLGNKIEEKVYYNSLYLSYRVSQGSVYATYNGIAEVPHGDILQGTNINLTTDCVHTLRALKEIGVITDDTQLITQKEASKMYQEDTIEPVEYH